MVSAETKSVIERAKRIYAERLQAEMESKHLDRFLAIEPESGEHFVGDTFDEAAFAALEKYPDRMSHVIRVGHRAALHLGYMELCTSTHDKDGRADDLTSNTSELHIVVVE